MNKYPTWKYLVLLGIVVLGFLYALPNLFGEDPAVQITTAGSASLNHGLQQQLVQQLTNEGIQTKSIATEDEHNILIRFNDTEDQLKAKDSLKAELGDDYTVALNLAPRTPAWLTAIGAKPMKLGLDLRGGVHFLLAIDVDSLQARRLKAAQRDMTQTLRDARIRYTSIENPTKETILVKFRNEEDMDKAKSLLKRNEGKTLQFLTGHVDGVYQIKAAMSPQAIVQAQNDAVSQTETILRNRINELGVAEPIVQRQGAQRIAVDLPGVQDTARAKQVLGGTATLEFHLVDMDPDHTQQALGGNVPPGTRLYTYEGRPYLLKDRVILSGSSITNAVASIGQDGRPTVQISLGGGNEAVFYRTTRDNIHKLMSIVYVETKLKPETVDGKVVFHPHKSERVINVATIQSALPSQFQIEGLGDAREARNLSLLLRAGALPAPISIIEESTVGPSLGKENITKGVQSIEIGFVLIVLFMIFYYRLFGLVANLALLMNLVLLIALLSVIGATLTLPAIAGILLTIGMAVDANVLIFERIREELRNGLTPQASIQAGYERALTTIVDSNVTTLIAAVAMFAIGTGAVKGFAVTLTLGLLTSMYTAITGSRAVINLIYGRRKKLTQLSIGIKAPEKSNNGKTSAKKYINI